MSSEEIPGQDGSPQDAVGAAEAEAADLRVLTDAKAMRAMAHPVRMALLELFGTRETLTATQASDVLGESPANCAFHLRTLAKYGFVKEAGGGRGRERPWALANRMLRITTEQPDPQAALAAGELGRLMFERWVERARREVGAGNPPPGWEHATGWTRSHLFVTAAESEELMDEMRRLLDRYEDRLANPARRPEGARPVEWSLFTHRVADWTEPPAGETGRDADK
ncbi:MAG TPA: helix-turn-helix domain-containing protein [Trebonia sp.]|nr:helix-turn-helix domain-containing protein [Trebonia sp.]